MQLVIRQAQPADAEVVSAILIEAAEWLSAQGMPLWRGGELVADRIAGDVVAGLFFLAECNGEPAGTIKFQLSDPLFWPDFPGGDAAYIHRLAIRRQFSGGVLSTSLMQWALARTAELGRQYLRLDCEASRPRLRAVYERFGFKYHSDRQVGPYLVARYEYRVPPASRLLTPMPPPAPESHSP